MLGIQSKEYDKLDVGEVELLHSVLTADGLEFHFEGGDRAVPQRITRSFQTERTVELNAIHRLGIGVMRGATSDFAEESLAIFTQMREIKEGNQPMLIHDPGAVLEWRRYRNYYEALRQRMVEEARLLDRSLDLVKGDALYVAAALGNGEHDPLKTTELDMLGQRALIAARLQGFVVTDDNGTTPLRIEPAVLANGPGRRYGLLPIGSQVLTRPLYQRLPLED